MHNNNHTAGNWELSNDHKPSPYVIRQIGRFGGLASIKFHGFNKTERARDEQTANARLMAAAPAFLGALRTIAQGHLSHERMIQIAADAITKATGGRDQ